VSDLLFGSAVVAALVAGTVALLAPCCISVMLPAYFASAAHNRRTLIAMTFLFGIGIATVILPIALGATVLRRLIMGNHTLVYVAGGTALVALGVYVLAGGRIALPMPGRRATQGSGAWSVYSLGVFSGVASSCCAPVLAGVVTLSGVAESFSVSLSLGLAYVMGMVGPLFVMALLWERFDWRNSRMFRPRLFSYRIGRVERWVSGTAVASGVLLLTMGVTTLLIGFTGASMATRGWLARLSAQIQHYGDVAADALEWVPGWAALAVIGGCVALLIRRARRPLPFHRRGAEERAEIMKLEERR
jgi:cytochrome c biogenesis protein CcdA